MIVRSPYYTTRQAAVILQRCQETIQRLCSVGEIPGAKKIGGQWYIPRTSIDPPVKEGVKHG